MKPGVYQEFLRGAEVPNFEAVIITGEDHPEMHNYVRGSAWRQTPGSGWHFGEGVFRDRDLRPHPDADRVWTEYCAAVLIGKIQPE